MIPLVILDVFLEVYHQVGFRLLRIPRVNRWEYIRIDRHKLSYLTPLQKIACAYCGYANGLLPYATQIAAETEKYWCAIMHESKTDDQFRAPTHHKDFLAYGDEMTYKNELARAKRGESKNNS